MRNVPPDKYNVAWFKLAECVSRGEKERALGVYRLLAHSLNDPAFARQLQGDILLSFNDTIGAVDHYRIAAQSYQDDGRILEAAAVYEHVVTLVLNKQEYLLLLVDLYRTLGITIKVISHATALFALYMAQEEFQEASRLVQSLETVIPQEENIALSQQLVFAVAQTNKMPKEQMVPHLTRIVHYLMQIQDPTALQRFLTSLEALNETYHMEACLCMEHEAGSAESI